MNKDFNSKFSFCDSGLDRISALFASIKGRKCRNLFAIAKHDDQRVTIRVIGLRFVTIFSMQQLFLIDHLDHKLIYLNENNGIST